MLKWDEQILSVKTPSITNWISRKSWKNGKSFCAVVDRAKGMQNRINQKNIAVEVPLLKEEERKYNEEYNIQSSKKLSFASGILDGLMPVYYRPGRHYIWSILLHEATLLTVPSWWGLQFVFQCEEPAEKTTEVD